MTTAASVGAPRDNAGKHRRKAHRSAPPRASRLIIQDMFGIHAEAAHAVEDGAAADAKKPRRAFRRITGAALDAVLPKTEAEAEDGDKATDGESKPEGDAAE